MISIKIINIEGEKNLEDVHGGKSEMYYNSGKWQDGIAEALINLDKDFKSKKYHIKSDRKESKNMKKLGNQLIKN